MLNDDDLLAPVLSIGVAAELTGLSPKQLRVLEAKGVLQTKRSTHGRRLYSLEQLSTLRWVAYLVRVRKVNAAGVLVALELLAELPNEERSRIVLDGQAQLAAAREAQSIGIAEDVPTAAVDQTEADTIPSPKQP